MICNEIHHLSTILSISKCFCRLCFHGLLDFEKSCHGGFCLKFTRSTFWLCVFEKGHEFFCLKRGTGQHWSFWQAGKHFEYCSHFSLDEIMKSILLSDFQRIYWNISQIDTSYQIQKFLLFHETSYFSIFCCTNSFLLLLIIFIQFHEFFNSF